MTSSASDPLADLIRADGSIGTSVPALASSTASASSAVTNTALASNSSPAAALPNIGGSQSLAVRASTNVQSSGPGVQRVSWDDNSASSGIRARTASYQPQAAVVSGASSSSHRNPMTHTVSRGETLFSLARRYNTNVGDLTALNHLAADGLQAGMVLRLPHSGAEG